MTASSDGRWGVTVKDAETGEKRTVSAKFVFIGAGGGALELLEKSKIPEGHGYGGFPVSGIWLRCDVDDVSARHHAKVYGKAAVGSPPMSVPHLDTRMIAGKRSLLFGPYAGFSSKFLKHGSYSDLFRSIEPGNVLPMLAVARDDWQLAEYLIGQVLQTGSHQFKMLEQFFPQAQRQDWREAVAGQRVQIIKPDPEHTGVLEFGTEAGRQRRQLDRRPARRLARRVNRRLHRVPGAGEVLRERTGGRLAGPAEDHHPDLRHRPDPGRGRLPRHPRQDSPRSRADERLIMPMKKCHDQALRTGAWLRLRPAPRVRAVPIGLTATGTRTETDSMGAIEVPADQYWGAQTQRSLIHFSIGDDRMPKAVYHAYGYVKKAAAIVNGRAGRLPAWKAELIEKVADEVIAGRTG